MTNSNPDVIGDTIEITESSGAFADGLTLVRAIMGPIIMLVIIMGWPDIKVAAIATMLFAVAAITDMFDDMIGGNKDGKARKFGWFDDIADSVLIISCLAGLAWAIVHDPEITSNAWAFFVPAAIYAGRDVLIGLAKGYELSDSPRIHSGLNALKTTLAMFAVIVLIAAPWLATWFAPEITAENAQAMLMGEGMTNIAGAVWWVGQGLLWAAAILSVVTGVLLTRHLSK